MIHTMSKSFKSKSES